jgi:hypothetical protein
MIMLGINGTQNVIQKQLLMVGPGVILLTFLPSWHELVAHVAQS